MCIHCTKYCHNISYFHFDYFAYKIINSLRLIIPLLYQIIVLIIVCIKCASIRMIFSLKKCTKLGRLEKIFFVI